MLKQRLDNLLESFIEKGPRGCSCSVVHRGKEVYSGCFGYSDAESKTPLTRENIFRIYSMSKVITCTAALKLFEEGRYLMHDPLYEYLPEFKDMNAVSQSANGQFEVNRAQNPILVKDLFAMTSGLCYPDIDTEAGRQMAVKWDELKSYFDNGETLSLRDFSKALATVPLAFEPGTHWRYGTSHDILGAFIEAVSGVSFEDFLKREIFEPLGMSKTGFRWSEKDRSKVCSYYHQDEKGAYSKTSDQDFCFENDRWPASGGGGLLSTLDDYQTFATMMAESGTLKGVRILGRSTIDMMRTNLLTPEMMKDYCWPYLKGYGYGFGVRTAMDRGIGGINTSPGEFGWSGLPGTFTLIDPEERLSIVYMQQLFPNLEEVQQPRIRAVVYGALV